MGRIVSLAEAMAYGDLKAQQGFDGQMFEGLLDAAEVFVEDYTGRRFSPDPSLALDDNTDSLPAVTKLFGVGSGQAVVRVPDLRVVESVLLNGSPLSAATAGGGYRLGATGTSPALRIYLTWPSGASTAGILAVTGRWGWLVPPEPVKHVVKALTMRMYREREAAWADSVAMPDGSVLSYFRQLPASIQGFLRLYGGGPKVALV